MWIVCVLALGSFVGDANTNGAVDDADIAAFLACMDTQGDCVESFDADLDGNVDLADFQALQAGYGLQVEDNLMYRAIRDSGWDMATRDPVHVSLYREMVYDPCTSEVTGDGLFLGRIVFYLEDDVNIGFFWRDPTSLWAKGRIEAFGPSYRLLAEENNVCVTYSTLGTFCGVPIRWDFDLPVLMTQGTFPVSLCKSQAASPQACCDTDMDGDCDASHRQCLCIQGQGGCSARQCDSSAGCSGGGTCTWYVEPQVFNCGGVCAPVLLAGLLVMGAMKWRFLEGKHENIPVLP